MRNLLHAILILMTYWYALFFLLFKLSPQRCFIKVHFGLNQTVVHLYFLRLLTFEVLLKTSFLPSLALFFGLLLAYYIFYQPWACKLTVAS